MPLTCHYSRMPLTCHYSRMPLTCRHKHTCLGGGKAPVRLALGRRRGTAAWLAGGIALGAAAALGALARVPLVPMVALAGVGVALAVFLSGGSTRWASPVTFRGVLFGVLLLAPILYGTMQEPLRERTGLLLA